MDQNKFGAYLSEHRKDRNMTQEEFASRMGVTAQAVSKWERGHSLPDISLIPGICDILNARADELLGISVKCPVTESRDEEEAKELLANLCADPLQLLIGSGLISTVSKGLEGNLIARLRLETVRSTGILIPVIRIRDTEKLKETEYQITSYDRVLYQGQISEITEHTYQEMIEQLYRQCREHYGEILNKQLVKTMTDHVKEQYPGVADGLVPERISYGFLKRILVRLVERGISIHNMIGILEILEEEVELGCREEEALTQKISETMG